MQQEHAATPTTQKHKRNVISSYAYNNTFRCHDALCNHVKSKNKHEKGYRNRSSPFHLPVLVLQGAKLEDPIPQVTHYMARALINPKPKKIYM
jgi:hypothetical protein